MDQTAPAPKPADLGEQGVMERAAMTSGYSCPGTTGKRGRIEAVGPRLKLGVVIEIRDHSVHGPCLAPREALQSPRASRPGKTKLE